MIKPLRALQAAVLALLLAFPAAAADVKPVINVSGQLRPVHSGETVGVANGGTSATTLTNHGVVIGHGTSALSATTAGTSGQVLTSNGASADPTFQAAPGGSPGGSSGQIQYNNAGAFGGFTAGGDCTFSVPNFTCTKTGGVSFAASATTDTTSASNISSGSLALARIAAIANNTVLGNASGGSATPSALAVPSCSGATNALTWTSSSGFGCNTISGTGTVTTTGSPATGDLAKFSGATSITNSTVSAFLDSEFSSTQGSVLYRGASAWAALAPGTSGYVLVTGGAGANPSWQSVTSGSVSGYSSGSWTPGIAWGGGTTGLTYTAVVGHYIRIGNLVMVQGHFTITNLGSSTGNATITGLPFTSKNTTNFSQAGTIALNYLGTQTLNAWIPPNSTTVTVWSPGPATFATKGNFNTNGEVIFGAVYECEP